MHCKLYTCSLRMHVFVYNPNVVFQCFYCCNFLFTLCYCHFTAYGYYSPHAAHGGRISLWISPPLPTPTPFLFVFCYVPRFLERGFPCLLREFGWVWVRNCCCCGPVKPFETLYMILVCTNKLDLTCLQLHHSYEACVCLNQSGSLCSPLVSSCSHDLLLFVPLSAC